MNFSADPEELICLDGPEGCSGNVEHRLAPDREDMKTFPRCDGHWELRLAQAEGTLELLSDTAPSWFDPANAGESWDEE